jgi:endonuclease YncB( thermonuclease family)
MTVWTVPATILRWLDSDTAECELDLGFAIFHRAKVRIDGLNAPELNTPEGQKALAWTRAFLPAGLKVIVTSRQWDKYGRVLGTLRLPDGSDYGQALIAAGHARPYDC